MNKIYNFFKKMLPVVAAVVLYCTTLSAVAQNVTISGDRSGSFNTLTEAWDYVSGPGGGPGIATITITLHSDQTISRELHVNWTRNITLRSDATTRTITQTGADKRHFLVNGIMHFENVIIQGGGGVDGV